LIWGTRISPEITGFSGNLYQIDGEAMRSGDAGHDAGHDALTTPDTVVIGPFESAVAYGAGHVFFTRGGNVMAPAPKTETPLTWVDRTGRPLGIVGAPGFSGGNLDVSPDGRQLAFAQPGHPAEPQNDIWLMELATGRATHLTDDHAGDYDPTWSPDGKYIVFNSARLGGSSLFLRASDNSGVDVPLANLEKSSRLRV
jgi:hypothetical protein